MNKIMFISLFALLTACTHKKIAMDTNTSKVANDTVSMNVLWLKDKGKKFDVEIQVMNKTTDDIIIKLNDMNCARGQAGGQLKHTFFNTGERTIDFGPNQMKQFKLVCDIGAEAKGDFKIAIMRVFDNPESDGATKGKQIAGKLEWIAKEDGAAE